MKRIKYVSWGLANSYSDRIEVNKELKNNKKLLEYVLRHEKGHKDSFDLKHEFDWRGYKLIPFVITHPRTWIDFLPFQYRNKQLIFDINLMILYVVFFSLIAFLSFFIL